jgi:hypothetical protein
VEEAAAAAAGEGEREREGGTRWRKQGEKRIKIIIRWKEKRVDRQAGQQHGHLLLCSLLF